MNAKTMMITAVAALFGLTLQATTLEVRNITVQQRVPWNGLVDVDYELASDNPDLKAMVFAEGYDGDTGKWIPMSALSGDGVNGWQTRFIELILNEEDDACDET